MQNAHNTPLSERIEKLSRRLHRIADQLGRDTFEADDIYQEMVIAILTKADPEDSNSRLLTRAKWVGLNYIKAQKTYTMYVGSEDEVAETRLAEEDDELAGVFEAYLPDTFCTPEDQMIEKERAYNMTVATEALSARDQQIVRLLACGFNQSEIAEKMSVNRSLISMRMKTIRKMFQQVLAPAYA